MYPPRLESVVVLIFSLMRLTLTKDDQSFNEKEYKTISMPVGDPVLDKLHKAGYIGKDLTMYVKKHLCLKMCMDKLTWTPPPKARYSPDTKKCFCYYKRYSPDKPLVEPMQPSKDHSHDGYIAGEVLTRNNTKPSGPQGGQNGVDNGTRVPGRFTRPYEGREQYKVPNLIPTPPYHNDENGSQPNGRPKPPHDYDDNDNRPNGRPKPPHDYDDNDNRPNGRPTPPYHNDENGRQPNGRPTPPYHYDENDRRPNGRPKPPYDYDNENGRQPNSRPTPPYHYDENDRRPNGRPKPPYDYDSDRRPGDNSDEYWRRTPYPGADSREGHRRRTRPPIYRGSEEDYYRRTRPYYDDDRWRPTRPYYDGPPYRPPYDPPYAPPNTIHPFTIPQYNDTPPAHWIYPTTPRPTPKPAPPPTTPKPTPKPTPRPTTPKPTPRPTTPRPTTPPPPTPSTLPTPVKQSFRLDPPMMKFTVKVIKKTTTTVRRRFWGYRWCFLIFCYGRR